MADPVPNDAVLVGIDGSETADRALAWAARYAALEDSPLVIAHALGMMATPEVSGFAFDGGARFVQLLEQVQEDGEALVAAAKAKVAESHPSVNVTTVVEHSDPRQLLLRLAESASLVVMGSRGRGAFRSLLLGSVTAGVTGRAGCPVVVIPAHDGEAETTSPPG